MGRYDQDNETPQILIIIILVTVVLVTAGLYLMLQDEQPTPAQTRQEISLPESTPPSIEPPVTFAQPTQQNAEQAQTPETGNGAAVQGQDQGAGFAVDDEVEQAPPLPPLAQSDAPFREDLLQLSKGLQAWTHTDDLLRKYLTIVNDFSQGLRLYKHMRFFKLKEPFKVGRDRHGLYLDPAGYQRYDKLAAAINAVDISQAIALYNRYRPLLLDIFAEFGYPEGHQLEDLFKQSASEILQAPLIRERISLYRPSVRYKFSSPKLEKLSPVQKQMIRMGPANTQIIQNKVRLFIEALINQPDAEGVILG